MLMNDAGGVGLFRSEFLYLESEDYPTEEAQFAAYRTVLESMGGKKVVIRTLDIGADKQIDYFKLDKEENPALGYLGHGSASPRAGNLQDPAAGFDAGVGVRQPVHYVPHDYFGRRSPAD